MYHIGRGLWRSRGRRRHGSSGGHPIRAAFLAVLCGVLIGSLAPAAAAGWDRVTWGMTASEIAAAYGDRALRLSSPIVFGDSYVELALREQGFSGYPFRVYFQMD